MKLIHQTIINILKLSLSIIFLTAGVSKIFYYRGFTQEIAQYFELYLFSLPAVSYRYIAVFLIITEIAIGFCLQIKKIVLPTIILMFLLLSAFWYLNMLNYFFPSIIGSVESCGCFGELIQFTPAGSFYKSMTIWTLSLYLLIYMIMINRPHCKKGA